MNPETLKGLKTIFSRQVVVFGGEYGRWKSLSLTALSYYECMLSGKFKVVSNMPLKHFPECIDIVPLIQTAQFDLHNLHEMQDSILIWDEMHNDVKARSPMSEANKYISQLSVGFRKDRIHLRGSFQYARNIDVSIDDLIEMKIVPTQKNTYSSDSLEDIRIRLIQKDFVVGWDCVDIKDQKKFRIELDLYPFLNYYNTRFKPYRLVLTHKDYVDKLEMQSKRKIEIYHEKSKIDLVSNIENWNAGLEAIP